MRTGLFFGSFNPIHIGHMAIANYMYSYAGLDELWFIVSPHNPLKKKASLLEDYHRLEMVNLAIDDYRGFQASNIEFNLPQPSYTIDTLVYLKEKYPKRSFHLIMGYDQLSSFHKWKNPELLLESHRFLVYPRPGYQKHELEDHPSIELIQAPMMEISSSFIRQSIQENKDLRFFLPSKVWQYIDDMNFYKKN